MRRLVWADINSKHGVFHAQPIQPLHRSWADAGVMKQNQYLARRYGMTLRQSPRADWVAAHDRMEDLIVFVPEWTKPCRLVGQQHDRSPHVMPVHPGSRLDKLVGGQMIDEVVECEVSRRHGAEVAIGDCRPAGADDPLASLPICSGGIFCSRDGRGGIQSCPELIELTREVTIDPRDHKAASTTFYQEALLASASDSDQSIERAFGALG